MAKIIARCEIDHSLPPSQQFEPSTEAARGALSAFVADDLQTYPYRRNNAADEKGVWRLSPYLHFGVIGPRTIVKPVRDTGVTANAKWKYLDEPLKWREYFHYLAFDDDASDQFQSVPETPRKSLLDHADDER